MLERDLTLYPLVTAEMAKIPDDKRKGPIVVCELTGRPWKQNYFRMKWRDMATVAGAPKTVFNMDSRTGGITEMIEATGGNLEAARKESGHPEVKMTTRYSHRKDDSNVETAEK